MTIIYSPEFNSTSYINLQQRQGQLLGLKVCGSTELLSELELRAGIVALEQSEPERLVAFHESLSKNVKGTIFEESFKTDEVGVARQLMAWTDNLLMAGWTPNTELESDKLKALAKIVKGIVGKHMALRWQDLTTYLKDHTIFQIDDVIEVHTEELIPAVIKSTLEQLALQATVNYVTKEGQMPTDFKVYHFKTRDKAYQWYLSQPAALNHVDVTISSDNCILNDMAIAMGKPTVNSKSQNSNPQLLQLFKLGLSLFARPLNVNNLLSYLLIPGNPVGGVSYKLAKVLAKEGGVNEEWQKVIDEFNFTETNEKSEKKDKRQERLQFLMMMKKDYPAESILVSDIRTYTEELAHWCDKQLRSPYTDDERKEQLVVLASFCRSLLLILPADGNISSELLQTHVDGIYRPQTFTHMKAQKGAPDVVVSITQLVDKAEKVCWLGCIGDSSAVYPFDFLNTKEIEKLKQSGITIPSKSVFYSKQHQMLLESLKNVHQLVLVTWEFDSNARQEEHPLITELRHQHHDDWGKRVINDEKPNLPIKKGNIVKLDPQATYQLSDKLTSLKREKESYSSITTMIQHPFDYAVNYLLKLHEPQIGQLPDLDTTKGLVAHRFVELLIKKYGEQMAEEYDRIPQEQKTNLMADAIQQKGAVLLLPEYKLECQQFKSILDDSVSVLTAIIQRLQLKPLESEVEMNVSLPTIGAFKAEVDLVLRNLKGEYVIFDFKWSEGKTYPNKLEENKSIQLELYKETLKLHYGLGSKIAGVAYYLFPKMTLFTVDFPESDHIHHIEQKEENGKRVLLDEINNSYVYRRNEFDKGMIEESEMTEISEIAYTKADTADNPLFPLEPDYNHDTLKGCPYVKVDKPPFVKKDGWKKNPTTREIQANPEVIKEIKTTHPILKGRLV
jgi:hypothetical protein